MESDAQRRRARRHFRREYFKVLRLVRLSFIQRFVEAAKMNERGMKDAECQHEASTLPIHVELVPVEFLRHNAIPQRHVDDLQA